MRRETYSAIRPRAAELLLATIVGSGIGIDGLLLVNEVYTRWVSEGGSHGIDVVVTEDSVSSLATVVAEHGRKSFLESSDCDEVRATGSTKLELRVLRESGDARGERAV